MSDGSDATDALEQRVSELEATVRGLTEELVDASERIRELERDAGMLETAAEKRSRRQNEASDEEHADTTRTESEDDTTKPTGGEGSADAEESATDDIIVA